jgi:hypothetical protein
MSDEEALTRVHPAGECDGEGAALRDGSATTSLSVDTFGGKIQVKWVPGAAVSGLGQMAFFIEFLKTSGLFDAWVKECPLNFTSPNAPKKRDVLGTILLSVLSGHWRYAHISAIRGDGVNPGLLGMEKTASEDSVRRALKSMDAEKSAAWLKKHLKASYEPLLEEPWALDIDTTVKPLYGHQQDAARGYNPSKPGRPSHAYHSSFIASLRIVLDVEVLTNGIRNTSAYQGISTGLGKPPGSRKSNGVVVCAAGVVGTVGWIAGAESSGISARGLRLGNGAGDGRGRTAHHRLPVQTEADDECKEADRPDDRQTRVGGCGTGLAGAGKRTAPERMDEETTGGVVAATAAGEGHRGSSQEATKDRQTTESGFVRSDI